MMSCILSRSTWIQIQSLFHSAAYSPRQVTMIVEHSQCQSGQVDRFVEEVRQQRTLLNSTRYVRQITVLNILKSTSESWESGNCCASFDTEEDGSEKQWNWVLLTTRT